MVLPEDPLPVWALPETPAVLPLLRAPFEFLFSLRVVWFR